MNIQTPVYLDYNATTPCDERVLEEMLPFFTRQFGNAASRSHRHGWLAEEAVAEAREQVARLIGASPQEIVFTSGATEADNLALKGVFELYTSKGNHIITCKTEHKAVLDTCHHLEKSGAEVTYLDIDREGLINLEELETVIRPTTILFAIMYANNETGVLQPVREIGLLAKKHGVLFFSDAVQAAGKIPVNVLEDGIDILSLSAHKMYGPKGVGAIYVRRKDPRVRLAAQMHGGGHERGMRSGTLNVPGIVGFGMACELARREMDADSRRLSALRDRLQSALLALGEVRVNGSIEHRLPHVCNLAFQHVEGDALMMGLNKNLSVSSGSACTSASIEPSYVLKALGLSDDEAHASIRFSLGRFTTEGEIDFAITHLTKSIKSLREISPGWELYRESIT